MLYEDEKYMTFDEFLQSEKNLKCENWLRDNFEEDEEYDDVDEYIDDLYEEFEEFLEAEEIEEVKEDSFGIRYTI